MSRKINQSVSFLKKLKKLPIAAQDVRCLLTTKEYKSELLAQINKAQKRIYIAALYLEADEAGEEVLNALYAAKQRQPNLTIVVCIDFHRAQRGLIGAEKSEETNTTWYQKVADLKGQGVRIIGLPVKRKEVFGVQHLKGFIFDDTVFYSGASINNIYLHHQDRYRYDRYWLIENKALADSMADFLQQVIVESAATVDLNETDVPEFSALKAGHKLLLKNLKAGRYQFNAIKTDGLAVTPLVGIGTKRNKINRVIRSIFQAAEQQVIIFTPYFNLPTPLARDLTALLKRGVKVTMVVGDKTANDFYIPEDQPFRKIAALPYLYEMNLRKFARKHQTAILNGNLNLHIWKHDTNSFHLKGIYADNKFALMTGHNLNPRAWRLDLENALLIDDPYQELAAMMQEELQQILTHSCLIEDYRQINDLKDYPQPIKQFISKLKRIKADKIVKGLI